MANVALIWGASPVIAAVMGWLLLREPVANSFLVAVALVVAGNAVIVFGSADGQTVLGLLETLALLMTVCWFQRPSSIAIALTCHRHCRPLQQRWC